MTSPVRVLSSRVFHPLIYNRACHDIPLCLDINYCQSSTDYETYIEMLLFISRYCMYMRVDIFIVLYLYFYN